MLRAFALPILEARHALSRTDHRVLKNTARATDSSLMSELFRLCAIHSARNVGGFDVTFDNPDLAEWLTIRILPFDDGKGIASGSGTRQGGDTRLAPLP